jgi:hypothetical protein
MAKLIFEVVKPWIFVGRYQRFGKNVSSSPSVHNSFHERKCVSKYLRSINLSNSKLTTYAFRCIVVALLSWIMVSCYQDLLPWANYLLVWNLLLSIFLLTELCSTVFLKTCLGPTKHTNGPRVENSLFMAYIVLGFRIIVTQSIVCLTECRVFTFRFFLPITRPVSALDNISREIMPQAANEPASSMLLTSLHIEWLIDYVTVLDI